MKKTINRILVLLMAAVISAGTLVGCGAEEELPSRLLPDYTARIEFETFAYGATSNGYVTVDGQSTFLGEDFINLDRILEYKEAGFDVMYITNNGFTATQSWEESDAKRIMDLCVEAGMNKVILTDFYVRDLALESNLVGEGSNYKIDSSKFTEPEFDGDDRTNDERALDAYIWNRMKIYAYHPTFYGLNMYDEPSWEYTDSLGKVYKSIRRLAEIYDLGYLYLQTNLGPLGFYTDFLVEYTKTEDGKYIDVNGNELDYESAYRQHIENYILATGADKISVDIYAFRKSGIYAGYFQTMQILKEVCQEYGVEVTYVAQSFQSFSGTTEGHSQVSKSEMMWEANVSLGFGVTNYAYYTYFQNTAFSTSGSKRNDLANFINWKGEKNDVYYYGQYILEYMKNFNEIISNYEYQGSKFYKVNTLSTFNLTPYYTSLVDTLTGTTVIFDNSHEFALVKGVEFDNDIVFLSELKDEENDLYMYMVQNVLDPRDGKVGDVDLTVSVDFGDYTWVAEYDCGNLRYVKLDEGKYETSLSAGYAKFIIPLE